MLEAHLFFLVLLVFIPISPFHIYAVGNAASSRTNLPAPIDVGPSQDWDGNDGPWSSFVLQVGTPAQDVRVLISTSSTQTVVVAPEGCFPTDPSDCVNQRGGDYNFTASKTWERNIANLSSNYYELGLGNNLGIFGTGQYGFDQITLGWQAAGGPTLPNQTVAGIQTKEFYLGLFGLNPRPTNFTNYDNPIPSYLENLRNQSLIPSTSWSYTAGNQYRLEPVFGSLVLGGYDASKFIPEESLSCTFNEEDARDLTVIIEDIVLTNASTTTSLLSTSIPAYIDSTVPQIWLPTDACKLFEESFGLPYDSKTGLYLLNETQHASLVAQNLSLTFKLTNSTSGPSVNITLPYAAFGLTVSYPIVANSSRYFAIKRASSPDQYTLGRALLQEVYLIADYDRRNFSVSQRNWDANAQRDIVPIYPPADSQSPSGTSQSPPNPNSLSPGEIAGISISALFVILFLALAVSFYIMVLKPRYARVATTQGPYPKYELHAESSYHPWEVDGYSAAEIEGRQINIELPAREEVAAEIGGDAVGWRGRSVRMNRDDSNSVVSSMTVRLT